MGRLTFGINVTLDGCCDHRAVAPVVLSTTRRDFPWDWRASRLQLAEAKRFKSGVMALRYSRGR